MNKQRERKFHVSYQWQKKEISGFGSITMTITGKLDDDAVQKMREFINTQNDGQKSIIIAIKELEI